MEQSTAVVGNLVKRLPSGRVGAGKLQAVDAHKIGFLCRGSWEAWDGGDNVVNWLPAVFAPPCFTLYIYVVALRPFVCIGELFLAFVNGQILIDIILTTLVGC